MQTKRFWGSAFAALASWFFLVGAVAPALADEIGPRFTMEYLSARWEIEEKVERLRVRIEAERAALPLDREMWDMADRLYKKNAMSKEEMLSYRSKFETQRALIEELQANVDYFAGYSLIAGYRVKMAVGGKVSDKEYSTAYLDLWKAQRTHNGKALERFRHEHEYLSWTAATQKLLLEKGASARQELLMAERKVIVAFESIAFHRKRIPVLECIVTEFQKIVDAGGKVDPQLPITSPCKSDIRPPIVVP